MRIIPFAISTVITAGLVFALNKPWGAIPPMGKFLSPQHGVWQNAEAADKNYSTSLKFDNLKGKAEVYFDERLVPKSIYDTFMPPVLDTTAPYMISAFVSSTIP